MKIKILTLIFCLFILSGCDITYNLNISKNNIEESTKIVELDEERFENDEISTMFYNNYSIMDIALFEQDNIVNPEENATFEKIDGIDYYTKIKNKESIGYTYKGTFNYNNFRDSSMLNYGVPLHKYKSNDNIIEINSGSFKMLFNQFPTLDNLKINIKVNDYAVVENNADEKNKNIYTWNITRDNYKKKSVALKLNNKTFSKVVYNDLINLGNNAYSLLILLPLIIVLIVIAIIIYKNVLSKKENANKF